MNKRLLRRCCALENRQIKAESEAKLIGLNLKCGFMPSLQGRAMSHHKAPSV